MFFFKQILNLLARSMSATMCLYSSARTPSNTLVVEKSFFRESLASVRYVFLCVIGLPMQMHAMAWAINCHNGKLVPTACNEGFL